MPATGATYLLPGYSVAGPTRDRNEYLGGSQSAIPQTSRIIITWAFVSHAESRPHPDFLHRTPWGWSPVSRCFIKLSGSRSMGFVFEQHLK